MHRLADSIHRHFPLTRSEDGVDAWENDRLLQVLRMRLYHMQCCMQLGLWTDALMCAEDCNNMIEVARTRDGVKVVIPGPLNAQYFDGLSQVFWVSENHLFHAYALYVCLGPDSLCSY
jgi:translation initiation factor 3 subunit A